MGKAKELIKEATLPGKEAKSKVRKASIVQTQRSLRMIAQEMEKDASLPRKHVADALSNMSDDMLWMIKNWNSPRNQRKPKELYEFNHHPVDIQQGAARVFANYFKLASARYPRLSGGMVSSRLKDSIWNYLKKRPDENAIFKNTLFTALPETLGQLALKGNTITGFNWNAIWKAIVVKRYTIKSLGLMSKLDIPENLKSMREDTKNEFTLFSQDVLDLPSEAHGEEEEE